MEREALGQCCLVTFAGVWWACASKVNSFEAI